MIQVETFEQTEMTTGGVESPESQEAVDLISVLGLKGQSDMISKKSTAQQTRCPYRQMTSEELAVYEILFPKHTDITEYDDSMIPLRVLQVASHAMSLGIYEQVSVWGEQGFPKDPILVGMSKSDYDNKRVRHILARWGNALESFDVLKNRAIGIVKTKLGIEARDMKRRGEAALLNLDDLALRKVSGEYVSI